MRTRRSHKRPEVHGTNIHRRPARRGIPGTPYLSGVVTFRCRFRLPGFGPCLPVELRGHHTQLRGHLLCFLGFGFGAGVHSRREWRFPGSAGLFAGADMSVPGVADNDPTGREIVASRTA